MSILGLMLVLATADEPAAVELRRVTFAPVTITSWNAAASRASTPAIIGERSGEPLPLPSERPNLPANGSQFSTLFRARDVFDISRHPARSVVKLYRLNTDGERQGTACTAQFVGPRHLVTAAHCIINRSRGGPHPGFEIALRHDGGHDEGVVPVTAAWVPGRELEPRPTTVTTDTPSDPLDPLNVGRDCDDIALLEVSEPAGLRLGWLGMSAQVSDGEVLHRFSYPHQSSAATLEAEAARPDLPPGVGEYLRREIESRRLTEPDFSPANLYYEYGLPDRTQEAAISEENGAVLPGRSGSAMIDDQGRVVAVMSRAATGINASCRLTPALIGTFAEIAGLDAGIDKP